MRLRKGRKEVTCTEVVETETVATTWKEDSYVDDDLTTLQDCLDRHKKVTKRSRRAAATPLDDEDIPSGRKSRKKCKGLDEVMAADSARSGEPLCSQPDGKQTSPNESGPSNGEDVPEGGKRRRVKKKRRRSSQVSEVCTGSVGTPVGIDSTKTSEHMKDAVFEPQILVAKVEMADDHSLANLGVDPGCIVGPEISLFSEQNMDLSEALETFLPVDGYHTCGDAQNCQTACLEKVLEYLDKMPEAQLRFWYKTIFEEAFASRSGEKVRGRLRRMIRSKVKEVIKLQSTKEVTSDSFSTLENQAEGDISPRKLMWGVNYVEESPGSKLSTSNAVAESVEADNSPCSVESLFTEPDLPCSPSTISRGFQLSAGLAFELSPRSISANETSTSFTMGDSEAAVQPAHIPNSPRRSRRKSKRLEKASRAAQECESPKDNVPECTPELPHSTMDLEGVCNSTPSVSEITHLIPPVSEYRKPADTEVEKTKVDSTADARPCSGKIVAVDNIQEEISSSTSAHSSRPHHEKSARAASLPSQPALPLRRSARIGERSGRSLSDMVMILESDNSDHSSRIQVYSSDSQLQSKETCCKANIKSAEAAPGSIEDYFPWTPKKASTLQLLKNSICSVPVGSPTMSAGGCLGGTGVEVNERTVSTMLPTSDHSHSEESFQPGTESASSYGKQDEQCEESLKTNAKTHGHSKMFKEATTDMECLMALASLEEESLDVNEEANCSSERPYGHISSETQEASHQTRSSKDTRICDVSVKVTDKNRAGDEPCGLSKSVVGTCLEPLRAPSTSSVETTSGCKFITECLDHPVEDVSNVISCIDSLERPDIDSEGSCKLPGCGSSAAEITSCLHVLDSVPCEESAECQIPPSIHGEGLLDLAYEVQRSVEVVAESESERLFAIVSAEKVSSLWSSELGTGCSPLVLDVIVSNVGGENGTVKSSRKWGLEKCGSGKLNSQMGASLMCETACFPDVWRDAGNSLEQPDDLYMSVGISDNCPSDTPKKRKFPDTDVDPDTMKRSGIDHNLLCRVSSRTRQRVEISSTSDNVATCRKIVPGIDVCEVAETECCKDVAVEQDVEESIEPCMTKRDSNVEVEGIGVSEELQDPGCSQYEQRQWELEIADGGSSREDGTTSQNDVFVLEESHETNFRCSSPPPCTSYLVEPPLCDSPGWLSPPDEGASPGSLETPDACINLLTCEQLLDEDDSEYYESSKLPVLIKMKLGGANCDKWPPPSLPPIRLKLPSGRARHQANGFTLFKDKSTRDWKYLDKRDTERKVRASTETSSPNSSDEDIGDNIPDGEPVTTNGPRDERSMQKLSLVLSPTSPSPPTPASNSNTIENSVSPKDIVLTSTSRFSKGILKNSSSQPPQASPKCKECIELRFQARTASDFVASQMKTFGEVAGRLTKEIQELRSILEWQGSDRDVSQDERITNKVKAISRSRDVEQSAEKNLTMLLRDCKRFCKLTAKRPRRIVFADEAGKTLCHVKTFESPPALARPLWDIL